jgi:hypothetical protein
MAIWVFHMNPASSSSKPVDRLATLGGGWSAAHAWLHQTSGMTLA